MAPEYLPFVAFALLLVLVGAALGVGLLLCLIGREGGDVNRRRRRWAGAALTTAMFLGALLFLLGKAIRQQFFLNEPLVAACAAGNVSEVRRLLAAGASPDAYGVDFVETALIAAAAEGHAEVVDLLLRSGASVDLRDSAGRSAIDWAKARGHAQVVQLLEQGQRGSELELGRGGDPE